MRLRVPGRVAEHLEGSQAAYTPEDNPVIAAVIARIRQANTRKDGSCVIEITDPDELDDMRVYIEAMEVGAADNVGYGDDGLDALADLNAARAVLRALARASEAS